MLACSRVLSVNFIVSRYQGCMTDPPPEGHLLRPCPAEPDLPRACFSAVVVSACFCVLKSYEATVALFRSDPLGLLRVVGDTPVTVGRRPFVSAELTDDIRRRKETGLLLGKFPGQLHRQIVAQLEFPRKIPFIHLVTALAA